MSKRPVVSGVGVLKVKLGAFRSCPNRRGLLDLKSTLQQCNLAKTAMVRFWERWREDHPDWTPEPAKRKDGSEVRDGRGRLCHPKSGVLLPPIDGVTESTTLYHVGCKAAPCVNTTVMATLAREVCGNLATEMPWNHHEAGRAKYRWQAVLWGESGRACFVGGHAFPVPNNTASLCYMGDCSNDLSTGLKKRLLKHGTSGCAFYFPLFSKQSGRQNKGAVVCLEVSQMERGQREVLRKIARKEWKLSDSKLVLKDSGDWFLHLCYEQPRQDLGLPKDREASLELLAPDDTHPLSVRDGEGHRRRLGDVDVLLHQSRRLEQRRRVLQERYRGGDGHGRGRFYRKVRPAARQMANLGKRFVERVVGGAIQFCVRNRCGTLVYREPSLPLRPLCWLGAHKVQFDWTSLANKLRRECHLYGIDLADTASGKVKMIGVKEYFEAYPRRNAAPSLESRARVP